MYIPISHLLLIIILCGLPVITLAFHFKELDYIIVYKDLTFETLSTKEIFHYINNNTFIGTKKYSNVLYIKCNGHVIYHCL